MSRDMKIAVVGAGLGGLAAAALLQQAGYDVHVYEQAASFGRIGAGIHLGPNVVKVLNKTSVGEELYRSGMEPEAWISRAADTGEESFRLPLRGVAEPKYGARYLTVHRGDLHALMTDAVNAGTVSYGKKLVDLQQAPDQVTLRFEDGTTDTADIVIGADGLNSMVRRALIGVAPPVFTGVVGHRVIFPASLLKGEVLDDFTKWWADDRHLITYYMSKSREEVYIVTGAPESEWTSPASFVPCSKEEFRACFEGFHPEVQKIIDLVPADGITKWAFFEHDPLPLWSEGRIVLLGDACHPMKPHMGQGAAMAIEDAAVLVRCIEETGISDYRNAFVLYEANRKGRTSRVQATSSANEWLRYTGDPDWVFGYDPFNEPLIAPASADAVS